jgi:hypothetical protein
MLMARPDVFGWNPLEQDPIKLYRRLVDLGIEIKDDKVCLADLDELEEGDVQA